MVVNYSRVSGGELARLTFLTPQTINVIVNHLIRAELLDREEEQVVRRWLVTIGKKLSGEV